MEFKSQKPDRGNKHWVSRKDVKGGGFWRKNWGKDKGKTAKNVSLGATAVGGLVGVAAILKNPKKAQKFVRKNQERVFKYSMYGLDSDIVEKGFRNLDKAPVTQGLKNSANNLLGKAKVMVGVMHSEVAFGKATLKNVNKNHNYATYTIEDGTVLSIGSIGRNTVTFQSYPNPNKGDNDAFESLISAFAVNNKYQAQEVDPSTSKKILASVRSMWQDQVENAPDNTIFMAAPFDTNPKLKNAKRNIYIKSGFHPVSDDSDWIWAMKKNGKLKKKLTDSDYQEVGFREDYFNSTVGLLEFRRPRTAKERQAISQGLKTFWDKEGRKEEKEGLSGKQKLAIGLGAAVLAVGGVALAAKKGKLPGFKTKLEPYRPQGVLPKKASQARVKKNFTDYSTSPPKNRKKGQVIPGLRKDGSNVVYQEPSPGIVRRKELDFPKGGFKGIKSAKPSRVQNLKSALNSRRQELNKALSTAKTKIEPYKANVDKAKEYGTQALNTAQKLAYVANAAARLKKTLGFEKEMNEVIEFRRGRVLTAKTKKKISEALKRKFGKKAKNISKKMKSATSSNQTTRSLPQAKTKTTRPLTKQEDNVRKSLLDKRSNTGFTGYQTRGRSKTSKGSAVERSSREGFTGYTPKSKSKQNKYTDNLKKTLGYSRDSNTINFRRPRTAEEKAKISRGVQMWWEKEGRTEQKREERDSKAGTLVGLGGLSIAGYVAGKQSKKGPNALREAKEDMEMLKRTKLAMSADTLSSKELGIAKDNLERLYKADSQQLNSLNKAMGKTKTKIGTPTKRLLSIANARKQANIASARSLNVIQRTGRGINKLSRGRAKALVLGTTLASSAAGVGIGKLYRKYKADKK